MHGERRRGGARVPQAQRAGRSSSTCWSTPRASRPPVAPDRREAQARFEAKPDSYKIPEKRVLSYVLLDRPAAAAAGHGDRPRARGLLQRPPEEFRQQEETCASHILVKVKATPEAEGHTDADAKALAAEGARPGEGGRRLRDAREEGVGGHGLGGAGRRPRLLPPGTHGARVRQRGLRARAGQPRRELVKTQFGYHVIRLASQKDETVQPFAEVKERIRASCSTARSRARASRRRRRSRTRWRTGDARGGRQGAGAHRAEERALRARRAAAGSPRPTAAWRAPSS